MMSFDKLAFCATSTELEYAIDNAKGFVDRLYEEFGSYAFVKEYPAFPITIKIVEQNYIIPIGTELCIWTTLWDVHRAYFTPIEGGIGQSIYHMDIDFEFVHRWLDVTDYSHAWIHLYVETAFSGSTTYYYIKINGMEGFGWTYETQTYDLYLGNEKVATITKNSVFPIEILRHKSNYGCYPAHRYTVRHGSQLTDVIYKIWNTPKPKLEAVINDYGFTYDIYDPLFGLSVNEDDNFMFYAQAYHDVDVYDELPRGIHYYPYWSKVAIESHKEN